MPTFEPATPIKAAAGIILTNGSDPRVLLARRSQALRFMAGFHVFPGGRIDDEEPTAPVINALDTTEARAVHAVAREIFEETGLLVGIVDNDSHSKSQSSSGRRYTLDARRSVFSAEPGTQNPEPDLRAARAAILSNTDTFEAFLSRHDLHIDATQFEFAGDWVTPAIAPIRFDTRYYIVRVPSATGEDLHVGEIDALNWYTPAAARQAWRDGTIQLPPPVAYVLQNLAAYPFPEVLDHLRDCGEHTGDRPSKMEFANGIYVLPLRSPTLPPATHTNCIIIGTTDLYLIDPAADDDEERALLTRQIQMLLDLGGTVKAIILTHSHIDHVYAADFCREHYGAPIWAHVETARQLGNEIRESGLGSGVSGLEEATTGSGFWVQGSAEAIHIIDGAAESHSVGSDRPKPQTQNPKPESSAEPGTRDPEPASPTRHTLDATASSSPKPQTPNPKPHLSAEPGARNPEPASPVDHFLNDGDVLTIPGTPPYQLRAIHTPGHDPGHLCFIEQTTRTLIAGDLIANPGTIVVSLDHGGDMTHFIDSLERLANDTTYDTILPAHGMPLTRGPEKIQKHLEHRLWREAKVKDALNTGARTIPELLPLAYDDVPPETHPLAELSLRAHLKRLESEL